MCSGPPPNSPPASTNILPPIRQQIRPGRDSLVAPSSYAPQRQQPYVVLQLPLRPALAPPPEEPRARNPLTPLVRANGPPLLPPAAKTPSPSIARPRPSALR